MNHKVYVRSNCIVCSGRKFIDLPYELYEDPCWKCNEDVDKMEQHTDDAHIQIFASIMKMKMKKKREGGRDGWDDKSRCDRTTLSRLLRDHVEKGDPVDVANFCMMLHQRGETIE